LFRNDRMRTLLVFCFACVAVFLTACSTTCAVVSEGSIQAYMPTPNKGLGVSIGKDTVVNRIQMGIRSFDKETMPLSGLYNEENFLEKGDPAYNEKADIRYRMIRFPVTLEYDHFEKEKETLYNFGLGLNPYPYFELGVGKTHQFAEFGLALNIGIAAEDENLKGRQIYIRHTLAGDMDDYRSREWDGEWKLTAALEAYLNILPIKNLALTYSFTCFYPQMFDKVHGYDVSFDFPPIFMNYVGGSYVFAKHYQVALGAIKYGDYRLKHKYWYVESSIGYLF